MVARRGRASKWRVAPEANVFVSTRMDEAERFGVQQQTRCAGGVTVEAITSDGAAQPQRMGRVHAQLVGAASVREEAHPSLSVATLDDLVAGDAHLAVHGVVDLVWSVVDVETEGQLDDASVISDVANDDGDVGLCDGPSLELLAEGPVGVGREPQDHQA